MSKTKTKAQWEAAQNTYDRRNGASEDSSEEEEEESPPADEVDKQPQIRVSRPNIRTHNPHIRDQPGSSLAHRSDSAQDERLPEASKSQEELVRLVPTIRDMAVEPRVICGSTRIVDEEENTIFVYLGERYGDERDEDYVVRPNPDFKKASQRKYLVQAFQKARQNNYKVVNDGFHPTVIDAYAKAVHAMAYVNTPKCDQTASRHGSVKKTVYRFPIAPGVERTSDRTEAGLYNQKDSKPGVVYSENEAEGCEAASVYHLVEGTEQMGHRGKGLYLSKDIVHSSSASTAVGAMYNATKNLEANVESVVKVFFPDHYDQMKKIYNAGKIIERPAGCHNARAIVFKLPVLPHWDDTDFGVTVSFPAGNFKGRYLHIPQLNLVFQYKPTSIAAFFAGCTVHWVDEWKPKLMEKKDEITPGRIGTVFYIPQPSADVLGDKEAGWGKNTNFETTMYSSPSTSVANPTFDPSLRLAWAYHLAGQPNPTKITGQNAIISEDLISRILFAQRKRKSLKKTMVIPQLSQEEIGISSEDADTFQTDFKVLEEHLFTPHQDFQGLQTMLSTFLQAHSEWCGRILGQNTALWSAFEWSLSAYCILLAPWSVVRIRKRTFNTSSPQEMAIFATQNIPKDEFIYELAGQLSADAASRSDHTDLSTMRAWDKRKRILFGPIRWVNHHCAANTEYFLLDDSNQWAITLKAARPILEGEEITVDYGKGFFGLGECRCSQCVPPLPVATASLQAEELPSDKAERKAKKAAKRHDRRDIQRFRAKEAKGSGKNPM
ncbi:Histone-lysine N-methyltransferase SET9 [Mycena sanguinolenta]|uniref:Histone-lysine N-methyltransferase SET9 n=1 Tax=Mycena sanguinolenta TaxID=230812 RepID=A0A8H6XLZ1_9AGAR|nr:Histone-lysine N-methyltransferase SET9 [Mycena sanguinolenta]